MSSQLVFIQEVHNNCRQTQETGCAVMAQSYFNWPSPSNTSPNCVKLSSSPLMDYWTAQERQQIFHFPSSLTKARIPVCNSSHPYCCSSRFLPPFLHAVLSLDPVFIVLFSPDPHRYVSETYVQHVCSIKKISSTGLEFLVCSSKQMLVHDPLNVSWFWLLELRWVRDANKHIYL